MQTRLFRSSLPARGFSLVELMIALTVLGLATAGVVVFTYQALNTYYYESGRLLLNHDMRKFTSAMTTDTVYSNYFEIYPDFATRRITTAGVTTDAARKIGETGDFLLLVFADTDPAKAKITVSRLIGYYRDPPDPADPTKSGPMRRFDVGISPAVEIGSPTNTSADPQVYTMADLLNLYPIDPSTNPVGDTKTGAVHTNPIVVQTATGGFADIVNNTTGPISRIFYNLDSSVMVNGQFTESGNLVRKAVNTYNFTISPRG